MEARPAGPPRLTAAALTGISGVRHGFFGRQGGVSLRIFESLNCGLGSSDDPDSVRVNRARAATGLGLHPDRLATAYQVHGTTTFRVDSPFPSHGRPRADALVSNRPGIGVGVLTADCAPILAADPDTNVIAAAHAGWRGALAGITDSMIDAMEELGARRDRIVAAVGPCISQTHYQVGRELLEAFVASDPANERFFVPDDRGDRFRLDLSAFVSHRLTSDGLMKIEVLEHCTYAEEDNFFSFRRATHRKEADYGRALAAIALAPSQGVA